MLKELSGKISLHIDALVDEMQNAFEENLPTYAGLSSNAKRDIRDLLKNLALRTVGFLAGEEVDREELYAFARMLGRNRSLQSIPFGDLVRAVFLVETIIWSRIIPEVHERDLLLEDWANIISLQSDLNSNLIAALSASYLEIKDEMINRQLSELHGLLEVGRIIVSTIDLDRVLHQILEVATGIMQNPMGAVYLVEEAEDELELVSQIGLSPPWTRGRRVDLDRSLMAQAMKEKAPVTEVDERLQGLALPTPARGERIRSVLSCPILKDDHPVGGLELYDLEPRTYNRLDMALLAAFAPQAGVAIENARLFGLERKRRRQALELKEFAEAIAGSVSYRQALGILVKSLVDISGAERCVLFFYSCEDDQLEFARSHGFPASVNRRLQSQRWRPHEMDEATDLAIKKKKVITTNNAYDDPLVNSERLRYWGIRSVLIAPLVYGGEVSGLLFLGSSQKTSLFEDEDREMLMVVLDQAIVAIEQVKLRERIHERERRVQELEASERVFKERARSEAIISANPDAIFLVDRDRNIILFNPAAKDLFGWREDEAVGRNVHEVLYGEEGVVGACPKEDCPIDAALRGEKGMLKEMEYARRDGSKVWISGTFSVIRNKKRQIENAICVFRDITEQKRLQHLALVDRELDIASHIQSALLPDALLENEVVMVISHQEQARIVGGDWYDYWVENNLLRLVIGDAAGSGIPAAILATLAMSAVRGEARYGVDILEVIKKANRAILPHRMDDRFITVFYSELDMSTLQLRYVNAGHNDPILIRGGGDLVSIESRKRTILGAFEHPDLEVEEIQLQPGDRIFLYTDGVIDCRDSRRRVYGEKRLRRYLESAGSRSSSVLIEELVEDLNDFCGGKMEDDFTILLCDVKKG
jgi:PAS domain S-box-containing protein